VGEKKMDNATTEWVVVADSTAIITRETGECWFLELDEYGDAIPFARLMTGLGSHGSTAALLNGAMALGCYSDAGPSGNRPSSLLSYIYSLIGSYHNARRTVGNYLKAARRFRELDRPDIYSYLEKHAREENGHERLALRDLRALNLPAERIVANFIPDRVRPLCELFDHLSSSDYPIGCVGYSYCFESSAALKQKADVDALQALCPAGVDASRFMRAHSSVGSEADHVKDMIDFVACLPASDRVAVVRAAYATAATVADTAARCRSKSDLEMWAEIQAAAGEEIHLPA
jgi:hypothetical protein